MVDPTRSTVIRQLFMRAYKTRVTGLLGKVLDIIKGASVYELATKDDPEKKPSYSDEIGAAFAYLLADYFYMQHLEVLFKQGIRNALRDARRAIPDGYVDNLFLFSEKGMFDTLVKGFKVVYQNMVRNMQDNVQRTILEGNLKSISQKELLVNVQRAMKDSVEKKADLVLKTQSVKFIAEATLTTYDVLGIKQVGALIEWVSVPDKRRCSYCASKHGSVYTIPEARGLIPAHPRCRCAWIPTQQAGSKK